MSNLSFPTCLLKLQLAAQPNLAKNINLEAFRAPADKVIYSFTKDQFEGRHPGGLSTSLESVRQRALETLLDVQTEKQSFQQLDQSRSDRNKKPGLVTLSSREGGKYNVQTTYQSRANLTSEQFLSTSQTTSGEAGPSQFQWERNLYDFCQSDGTRFVGLVDQTNPLEVAMNPDGTVCVWTDY